MLLLLEQSELRNKLLFKIVEELKLQVTSHEERINKINSFVRSHPEFERKLLLAGLPQRSSSPVKTPNMEQNRRSDLEPIGLQETCKDAENLVEMGTEKESLKVLTNPIIDNDGQVAQHTASESRGKTLHVRKPHAGRKKIPLNSYLGSRTQRLRELKALSKNKNIPVEERKKWRA